VAWATAFLGLSGCEALLSVGNLTERPIDDGGTHEGSGDVVGDASSDGALVTDDGASGGDGGPLSDEASAIDGAMVTADGPPVPGQDANTTGTVGADGSGDISDGATALADSSSTAESTAVGDGAGAPADSATERVDASAGGVDSSTGSVDSAAPPAGDAGSASGCVAGAAVVTMAKLNTVVKLGTIGRVCVQFKGTVSGGWNASSVEGRSVTVTGSTTRTITNIPEGTNQPALLPGSDGYIYWNYTAGYFSYATMYAYQ
jgi:hypothetical protein